MVVELLLEKRAGLAGCFSADEDVGEAIRNGEFTTSGRRGSWRDLCVAWAGAVWNESISFHKVQRHIFGVEKGGR